MADRKRYYENGSAAYDIFSTAAQPLELPEEKQEPSRRQKTKVKAKLAIAPFTLIGALVAVVLLTMVIYSYVQLFEASSRVGKLSSELTAIEVENSKLRSSYESSIDLTLIELEAKQLGMRMPSSNQEIYLNVSNTDRGEVITVEKESVLSKAWEAVSESFTGILEYFF